MDDTQQPPLERILKLIEQLSKPHAEHVWTGETIVTLDRSPLLTDLRRAIHGDLGRSGGGRSQEARARSVLDLAAFTLYEDITGRIDAFYKALTGHPPKGSPEETLQAWYVAYRAFHMSGKYSDPQVERVRKQLARFVGSIRGYFDPPRVKELEGACPMELCRATHIKQDGVDKPALYVAYRQDEQPIAKCRACGTEWFGERPLLELGYYLGANVDVETLRSMGVAI